MLTIDLMYFSIVYAPHAQLPSLHLMLPMMLKSVYLLNYTTYQKTETNVVQMEILSPIGAKRGGLYDL